MWEGCFDKDFIGLMKPLRAWAHSIVLGRVCVKSHFTPPGRASLLSHGG